METLFASFGRATVRFRWLIVIGWIVIAVASMRTLPSLGSEINNNNSHFLPSSAPSIQAFNLATPLLGNNSNTSVVVLVASSTKGTITAADAPALTRVANAASSVQRVTSVRFVGVSPNRQAAQIFVSANINANDINDEKTLVNQLEHTFALAHGPPDLQFHVAGAVAANVANQAKSASTGNKVQEFSILFIIVILFFVFRSLLAPIVTLLPAALALLVANRFIGGLGAHGLQISEFTALLLIVLMLGAGTDYGLFLVFRVREELREGRHPHEAVAYALSRIGVSITASAGTVVFALLSLLLASFGIYSDLGIPLALGIAVMLLAGLTLLPALLSICGRAVFWPSAIQPGATTNSWWADVARRLLRHPARTLAVGLLLFGGLALAALSYKSGGFGGAVNAPAGSDAAIGNSILVRDFPQASVNPTNVIMTFSSPVWEHPADLATAETVLRHSGEFTSLDGPLNPNGVTLSPAEYTHLHALLGDPAGLPATPPASLTGVSVAQYDAYHATTQFVSRDGRTIQFEASLTAGNPDANAAIGAVPGIRRASAAAAVAAHATAEGVAGDAPALYDVDNTSNHDLVKIVPIAIAAIALLLALVLRSLIAPLYLIFSVGLSYLAALGVAVLVFIDIGGDSGLTFVLPFLMFIFLLALGEDYNILVMTRIREEARHRDLPDAVAHAVGRTGPTITSAGLVLAGSFAVLAFVGHSGPGGGQIEAIGFGLAIGILMDTFLVRVVLVPATVVLLGRWNWWPTKLAMQPTDELAPTDSFDKEPVGSR